MDHDHMGHGGMDHGHMDKGHQCSMNMIFTWDTTNLCLIFDWWHVSGPLSLILSLLGVVALTAGYEAVREASRRYELAAAEGLNRLPPDESAPAASTAIGKARSWFNRIGQSQEAQQQRNRMIKAAFYAVQVFYSFFIMLLFMTYNGFVMLAVAVGAFVGYVFFGGASATKTVACH